ncbi:hypothetical protein ACFX2I_018544 [Malus domestica]
MILSTLGPSHSLMLLFLGTHTRTSQWVTYPGNSMTLFSFNFRVPMEPAASELPKGLALGRDENIHIRLTGSTPLSDVGCYNLPPLGARRLHRYIFNHGLALIPNCHISARAPTTSSLTPP